MIIIILCVCVRERAAETVRIERCGEKTFATLQSPSPHTHYLFVPFLFYSHASFVITLWFLFLLLSLLYNIFFFLHIVGLQPLNASHSSFELKNKNKEKIKSRSKSHKAHSRKVQAKSQCIWYMSKFSFHSFKVTLLHNGNQTASVHKHNHLIFLAQFDCYCLLNSYLVNYTL